MNVVLYVKLSDIPIFVLVNHKTKEACDGLRINPINDESFDLKISLKIINSYFPKLETLYLTDKSIEAVCNNIGEYKIPNVGLFKANNFVSLSLLRKSQNISCGIDKVLVDELSFDPLYNTRSIKINISLIPITTELLKPMKLLKRIYIYGYYHEYNGKVSYFEQINSLSHDYQIIFEYTNCFDRNWKYKKLNEVLKLLDPTIFLKHEGYYSVQEYDRIGDFKEIKEDVHSQIKRMIKKYYPLDLFINYSENIYDFTEFDTINSFTFLISGNYKLPINVETVEARKDVQLEIDNWNELNKIKRIFHYDYNVNTPPTHRKFEKNTKNKTAEENLLFVIGVARIITIVMAFLFLFRSLLNSSLFGFKEHYTAIFPFLLISIPTYFIPYGFALLRDVSKKNMLFEVIFNVCFFLMLLQYFLILFYDQRYYGLYCSEIIFLLMCFVSFTSLDSIIILYGFGKGYLKRNLNYLFPQISKILVHIIPYVEENILDKLSLKIVIASISLPFIYCFIMSLFTTHGILFVGNLINTTITIGITCILMALEGADR